VASTASGFEASRSTRAGARCTPARAAPARSTRRHTCASRERRIPPCGAIDDPGLYWWHSIRLPDGTLTPGEKSAELLEQEWASLRLPALASKTVLDVGAWDGWFSFRC
jgi:hypothetical protein